MLDSCTPARRLRKPLASLLLLAALVTTAYANPTGEPCLIQALEPSPGFFPNGLSGHAARLDDFIVLRHGSMAHIYRRSAGVWSVESMLPNIPSSWHQGNMPLGADGDVFAIGNSVENTVHVYRRVDGAFSLEQQITHPKNIRFGFSVAVEADVLLVGATYGNAPDCSGGGLVFVYRFDGASWQEEAQLHGPDCNVTPLAGFGHRVAISGDVIMVGDELHRSEPTGAAFAFRYQDGEWVFEQTLKPSDFVPDDEEGSTGSHRFGSAIALDASGTIALIGARTRRVNGLNGSGAAYLWEYVDGNWVEGVMVTPEVPASGANFGRDLDISAGGETLLIGQSGAGAIARFFRQLDGKWQEVLQVPGGGTNVRIDGDIALLRGTEVRVYAGVNDIDCNSSGNADGCDIALGFSADVNNDGIPDECQHTPDLTGDGNVGVGDLLMLLAQWGPCPDPDPSPLNCPADLDGDGSVGVSDLLILLAAWGPVITSGECPAGNGDCCAVHSGAGCGDGACCQSVCADDAFCCSTRWDVLCVHAARDRCGCPQPSGCGDAESGPCCEPSVHPGDGGDGTDSPGCELVGCCESICDLLDPFCCDGQWDATCAGLAFTFCGSELCPPYFCLPGPECVCGPGNGDCCIVNGSLGCEDWECCNFVGTMDPFCVELVWDGICAGLANNICEVCQDGR